MHYAECRYAECHGAVTAASLLRLQTYIFFFFFSFHLINKMLLELSLKGIRFKMKSIQRRREKAKQVMQVFEENSQRKTS
jgi:hypothetical protein